MEQCLIFPSAFSGLHSSSHSKALQAFPISIGFLSRRQIYSTHFHDYLQIWYTVSGRYRHTVEGTVCEQHPGSAMLVFPYMEHSIDTSQSDISEMNVFYISIKKGLLEDFSIPFLPHTHNSASFDGIPLNPFLTFSEKDRETADRIILGIAAEYQKRSSMNLSRLLSFVSDFLILCSAYSDKHIACTRQELLSAENRNAGIDNVLDFLVSNSAKSFSLNDLSRAAMMSRSSFSESFRAKTGQSCYEYVRSLRMQNAVRQIRFTEKSISEIAAECGFYDSSHFSRQCAAFYGVSPVKLRRELSQWTREYGDALFKDAVRSTSWAVTYDEEDFSRHYYAMGL